MNRVQYEAMARVEDVHFWFAGKRAYIASMFNQFRLGGKILDVGCGTGAMTKFLTRYGEVVGIDRSPFAMRLALKRGLDVRLGSANKLPFADCVYDVVTVLDMLYHKGVDEQKALVEAYRVLKPGGYIVITDCAIPWLWGPHDEVMHAKRRYWKPELEAMVTAAGFEIRKSSYMFTTTFPLFVLSRLLMRWRKPVHFVSTPPQPVNALLTRLLQWEARLLPYVKLPIGSSVIIAARKAQRQESRRNIICKALTRSPCYQRISGSLPTPHADRGKDVETMIAEAKRLHIDARSIRAKEFAIFDVKLKKKYHGS